MKPRGYWVTEDLLNTRNFFDSFASSFLNRDPLLPSSWHDVSVRDVIQKVSFLFFFLLASPFFLFFSLAFSFFLSLPFGYFYIFYIFLLITYYSIMKGGGTLLQHYGGSLIRALIDVYPNVSFNERDFLVVPRMFHYY